LWGRQTIAKLPSGERYLVRLEEDRPGKNWKQEPESLSGSKRGIDDWITRGVRSYLKMWTVLGKNQWVFSPDPSHLRSRPGPSGYEVLYPADFEDLGTLQEINTRSKRHYPNFPALIVERLDYA